MSSGEDLGFTFRAVGGAVVQILRDGRMVTVLRERRALDFLDEMAGPVLAGPC